MLFLHSKSCLGFTRNISVPFFLCFSCINYILELPSVIDMGVTLYFLKNSINKEKIGVKKKLHVIDRNGNGRLD